MKNSSYLSPNFSKKRKNNKKIVYVIIHYTGMQSEIESLNRLRDKKAKVSCHYLINRKGKIIQMVLDKNIAWHAGKSKWKNHKNLNKNSIGIELVNKGHQFGYERFTNLQIEKLISICNKLKKKYKISPENFLGHSDVAPLRKIDPGEYFPWKKLSKFKIGKWYDNNSKFDIDLKNRVNKYNLFFKNLYRIGYRYFKLNKKSPSDRLIIKAFQRRYLPDKATGKIDYKTLKISDFLAKNIK